MQEYPQEYARISIRVCKNIHKSMQEYPQEYARTFIYICVRIKPIARTLFQTLNHKNDYLESNNHHVYSNNNWAVELTEISSMIVYMYIIQDADTIDQSDCSTHHSWWKPQQQGTC